MGTERCCKTRPLSCRIVCRRHKLYYVLEERQPNTAKEQFSLRQAPEFQAALAYVLYSFADMDPLIGECN